MNNPALQFKNFDEFLADRAKRFGSRPCITDGETKKEYSYHEVNSLVDKTAAFLWARGLRKGDRFGVLTRNSPEFLLLYLASMKLGTLIVPLVIDTPTEGIGNLIKKFSLKALFFSAERAVDIPVLERAIENGIFTMPIAELQSSIRELAEDWSIFSDTMLNDPGSLYFSSGTTGEPKGIPQSPKNLLTAAAALAESYQFTEDDTQVGVLPCYHTALVTYGFWPSLWAGSNFVVFERFHKTTFWKNLAEYKASFVEVVPTILVMLLNSPEDVSRYDLSHVKFIGSGSAPLFESLHAEFERTFGVRVANQYGLSETAPTHFNDPRNADRKLRSIGMSMPFIAIRILKEDGAEASSEEMGEIVMKGDSIIDAYHENPGESKRVFREGWFYTGDVGYKDADGYYYITDRKKEMISRGGAKIYPSEIDALLVSMTEIREAATVGVPDAVYGEVAVSYVVPKENAEFSSEKILNRCRELLPSYKCPSKIIAIDEIPKTPSGKIMRRVLTEKHTNGTVSS